MSQFSKLQIRAKVLSVVSEIKMTDNYDAKLLSGFISQLEQIDDREALFDVFVKEYIKMNEKEYTFSSCLLKALVPKDYVTDKVYESLKSSLSDDSKYKLVQLLRVVGGNYDYDLMPSYFEDPDEVFEKETKKLLDTAIFNPESMLDFLDFVSAVSQNDRNLLLSSLSADYNGDCLANIIYPILYSDFEDDFVLETIKILAESKSSLGLAPFNYLIEISDNQDIISACKNGLKKLKLSGASEEKADGYFKNIIKNTIPAKFYTTVPDGNGNQALLISRTNQDEKILLAAVVINDKLGIIDCFGFFNISREELNKVLNKFYQSEGKYKVPPEYIKSKISHAFDLTVKNKRKFPYEYICWSPLLQDINKLENSVEDFVDTYCAQLDLTVNNVTELLTYDYTLRWFITPNENIEIKYLVDYIFNSENLVVDDINQKIKEKIDSVFSCDVLNLWINRFYNLIYLLMHNLEKETANKFYTILKNENHFNLFKIIILQRSIYSYFVTIKENAKNSLSATNIFTKRNLSDERYNVKKLDKIIEFLNKSWLNG